MPSLFQALLTYRNCLLTGRYAPGSGEDEEVATTFVSDVAAFRSTLIEPNEVNKDIRVALQKGKFIPNIDEPPQDRPTSSNMQHLTNLLYASDKMEFQSNLRDSLPTRPPAVGLAALTAALPFAATQVLKGDETDDATTQSPRGTESTSGDIRRMVRFSFEETFITALSRIHVKGAYSLGAVLALELETELFNKYCVFPAGTSPGSNIRPEFNKKDYRKHQLMLQRNLKQSHNDHLVSISNT